ncbi:MAG TPA: hypothetical protein DCL29_02175 [Eubacterium sp.]|nr:hypothetical protein [Eubacterium sp.]
MAIQSEMKKTLCCNINEVKSYLTNLGFTISGNKMLWDAAESDTQCYWQLQNNIITFKRTDGESAFIKNLVDFDMTETIDEETVNRNVCAIVFIPLANDGCALYLGMVPEGTNISDITFSCYNGNSLLNNGLVVCSPAEADGHWYYGWNAPVTGDNPDEKLRWCLDNGHNNYEYGDNVSQIPMKLVLPTSMSMTLVRAYMNFGDWSQNFRVQVTGDINPPGSIFKINGQKYIVFSNNSTSRAPAYKLPAESVILNLSTSTEEFSPLKTYGVNEYCIYEGLLYKSRVNITTPGPFDESQWTVTTVYNEKMNEANNIYGG